MSASAVALYAALLRLYPRRFRDEYGADMTLLFANQLRDESAIRVLSRGVVDLAITIPSRHLEAHMNRPPAPAVPLLFTVLSATGLAVAVVGGSSVGMLAVGLPIAAVAGVLALIAWRRNQGVSATRGAAAHWWKFLFGGAAALGAVAVVTTITGEVDSGLWLPMMLTLLGSVAAMITGLALGVSQWAAKRTPLSPPGPAPR